MSKVRHIDFSPKLSVRYVSGYSQWGYGYVQNIALNDLDGDVEVHYSLQESGGTAVVVKPTVENGIISVDVPNFLFAQESIVDYKAYCFIYTKGKKSGDTIKKIIMNIDARPRPEDYVYSDEDFKQYDLLEQRIKHLEENPVSDEYVQSALDKYFEENPVDVGVNFETDDTLKLENGILSVNTTNNMEQDNTLPMTSAGVYAAVGNIEAILKTI